MQIFSPNPEKKPSPWCLAYCLSSPIILLHEDRLRYKAVVRALLVDNYSVISKFHTRLKVEEGMYAEGVTFMSRLIP